LTQPIDDPWANVPEKTVHVDHRDIIRGPFDTPQDVTRECITCHAEAANQMIHTTHFTWESDPVTLPGHDLPVTIGKKNQINNFCIGIQGNWNKCTTCHAGYGWSDANYDFQNPLNVDCLICHADTTAYSKGVNGMPAEGVDLLAAARTVHAPMRTNCGRCHFDGGGGNGVKHGDLDESLYYPADNLDVHMGKNDFQCTDCHQTKDHQIKGRAISVTVDGANQVECTDCHSAVPHSDGRLNFHTQSVACQTCHIPAMALEDPTKIAWDWSTAGEAGRQDDHFTYLKIKGSFIYEKNYTPTYMWFNGQLADRYILGDMIDPGKPTIINQPAGDIHDTTARIAPFKLHIAKQPYDTVFNYLLQPRTAGQGGFWTTFDWKSALALGAQDTGMQFSGQYGFTETWMYWQTSHMVQPAANALQCNDCHSEDGRLDWKALGYPGDPMLWGGRFQQK
jgi:octaheme c-type cytochrome (tetrathionate reductase family)